MISAGQLASTGAEEPRERATQDPGGGGVRRPQFRARDLLRERCPRAARPRPGALRDRAGGHRPRRVPADTERLAIGRGGELPSVDALAIPGAEIATRPGMRAGGLTVLSPGEVPRDLGAVDVVLPLLHGASGEGGTIQGLLEMTGARDAGAGVFASAAGMDKEYMKLVFAAYGLPMGPYVVVRDRDWTGTAGAPGQERKRVLDEIAELGGLDEHRPAQLGDLVQLGWP